MNGADLAGDALHLHKNRFFFFFFWKKAFPSISVGRTLLSLLADMQASGDGGR